MKNNMAKSKKNYIDFDRFFVRSGLSQSDLAKAASISAPMMSLLVSGDAAPSYSSLRKLFQAGMTAEELFGMDEPEKRMSLLTDYDCERIAKFVAARIGKK